MYTIPKPRTPFSYHTRHGNFSSAYTLRCWWHGGEERKSGQESCAPRGNGHKLCLDSERQGHHTVQEGVDPFTNRLRERCDTASS